jgi:hypothetical protein
LSLSFVTGLLLLCVAAPVKLKIAGTLDQGFNGKVTAMHKRNRKEADC